jgi:hypothetical protein
MLGKSPYVQPPLRKETRREILRRLYAEIDALRRLPVIDVCGHCKFMDTTHNVCTHCEEGETPRPVMCLQPVPSWCPLRGAR